MSMDSTSSPQGTAAADPGGGRERTSGPGIAEREPPDTLIDDAVSLLDSVVEYLGSIFRLERYRIEVSTRRFVQKALILVSGAAVLLLGVVFLSIGVSSLLSEALQAPYAGPLIVGGFYALGGLIAVLVVAKRKES